MYLISVLSLLTSAPVAEMELKPVKPEKEKKICLVETRTGSRLDRGRVCRTAAEWDAIRKEASEKTRDMQERTQNPVAN